MRITPSLAKPIIQRLKTFVHYNINIMDEEGVIVASGDENRLSQHHQGAIQVLSSGKEVVIDEGESPRLPGTRPGVNLPIQFQDRIAGVVGITGDPQEITQLAHVIKMSVEVLLQQVHMNAQLHYRRNAVKAWVHDLIHPYDFDHDRLSYLARSLSIDTDVRRSVFLIEITSPTAGDHSGIPLEPDHTDQALFLIENRFKSEAVYARLEMNRYFVALTLTGKAGEEEKALADRMIKEFAARGISIAVGIGKRSRGVKGYRTSYEQAKQSIRLQKIFGVCEPMVIEDWGIVRFVEAVPEAIRMEYLEPFASGLNQLDEEAFKTLEAFLSCGLRVKETAENLHIHRNTLLYRLNQISSILDLDPRRFEDAVHLRILLLCRQLSMVS